MSQQPRAASGGFSFAAAVPPPYAPRDQGMPSHHCTLADNEPAESSNGTAQAGGIATVTYYSLLVLRRAIRSEP